MIEALYWGGAILSSAAGTVFALKQSGLIGKSEYTPLVGDWVHFGIIPETGVQTAIVQVTEVSGRYVHVKKPAEEAVKIDTQIYPPVFVGVTRKQNRI